MRVFLFICCICCVILLFLSACGEDNPTSSPHPTTPPQVLSIDVHQGEQISELRPITVIFNKEMAYVDIKVDGAEGTVVLNGNKAIWTPSSKTVSPGAHLVFVMGMDKSGQQLVGYSPVVFVNNQQPLNPWEAISKASVGDLWFPGNVGSKWVYSGGDTNSVSFVELNGKSYKAIGNSSFPGELSKNPMYVFRDEGSMILGYAEEDKKREESDLEQLFRDTYFPKDSLPHKQLIDAGFTDSDIQSVQFQHESMDEWVILEKQNLMPGNSWLVTRTHTSAWIKGQKVADIIQGIRAFITGIEIVKKTINKASVDIPVDNIEYRLEYEDLQGNPRDSHFLCGFSVSPGIGMVSFTGTNGNKSELVEYNIVK